MKQTVMFIYHDLNIGGIQKFLIFLIRELKKKNIRIIWLTQSDPVVAVGFKKDIEDIEKYYIDYKNFNSLKKLKINFTNDEEILALAFSFREYCNLERFKKYNNQYNISTIFWVPHFEGRDIFFEEYFYFPINKILKKYLKNCYEEMDKNNNIFYVNELHLNEIEKKYKIKVENRENKIYKNINIGNKYEFNSEKILKKYNQKFFNILTIGRFDIPHKGYIIGLIDSYRNLKKKYPKIQLSIIGYGNDEKIVLDKINSLSFQEKKDLKLIGKIEYDELKKYFDEANLFIGVAGAIRDASTAGVLSVPVRHYSLECEGYGFSYEKKEMAVSKEKGIKIDFFIEKVIQMSYQEYFLKSKKTYEIYNSSELSIGNQILSLRNKTKKNTISFIVMELVHIMLFFYKNLINLK